MTPIRRVFKDAVIYGSGDLVLRASAFITIPVYTRILLTGEYGVWNFLITAGFLLNAVLILGGDAAFGRFFFATQDIEARRVLTSTWFAFLTGWSLLVALLALPFAPRLSQFAFGNDKFWVVVVLTLLTGPVTVISAMLGHALRNEFRPVAYALVNLVSTSLGIAFSLYLVVVEDLAVTGVLLGGLLGAVALVPVRIWLVRDLFRPVFDTVVLRPMLRFALPLVPVSLAAWVLHTSDRIVLGKLSSFHEVGLYSLAFSVVSLLFAANAAVGLAWSPHAIQAYEKDEKAASILFGRVLTYIVLAFGAVAVLLTTFAHELLVILTVPSFYAADSAIGPLAIGVVALASTQVTGLPISLRHRTGWLPFITGGVAALNLGLNLALVPRYGMLASAWATAACYLTLTFAFLVLSQRLWGIEYETRKVLALSSLIVAFVVGASALPEIGPEADVALKVAYVSAFVLLLFGLRIVGRGETHAAGVVLRELALRRS